MKILAIIVTYNGMEWYDRCFTSLESSSFPVDIFVADNASSDGTVEYIKTYFPNIILFELDTNLGFGQGNNKGMRYALDNGYDFVFLLNQDAWLAHNDAIEKLVNAYQNSDKIGILSPVHLYGCGTRIIDSMKKNLVNHTKPDYDLLSDLFFNQELKEIYTVDYSCAAAWFLPIQTIREIGGFDPLFFHYGEDDNYIQRVKFHGYEIGVCPNSQICHDIEARGENYGMKDNNWSKNFLVYLADVNASLSLQTEAFRYLYFSLIKLFTFQITSARNYFKAAAFIVKKMKAIENSRFKNKQQSQNWL